MKPEKIGKQQQQQQHSYPVGREVVKLQLLKPINTLSKGKGYKTNTHRSDAFSI